MLQVRGCQLCLEKSGGHYEKCLSRSVYTTARMSLRNYEEWKSILQKQQLI